MKNNIDKMLKKTIIKVNNILKYFVIGYYYIFFGLTEYLLS